MNMTSIIRASALACGLATLAGCGIHREVDRDLAQARQQVLTQSITLNADDHNVPDAKITPQDDLLIDGRQVPLTTQQRFLVHSYREQTVHIALDGIEIGRQGADLGMHAAWPAALMALTGASDEAIERHVQKKIAPIHAAVAKLCDRLPALMATGQQLADSLPAFRPYATLTPEKIDECRTDALDGDKVTSLHGDKD